MGVERQFEKLPDSTKNTIVLATLAAIGLYVLTGKKREKEAQEGKAERMLTDTSADSPWNAQTFINKAVENKAIVLRYVDGGAQVAKEIWDKFGYFDEDETALLTIFKKIGSQYQVAQIGKWLIENKKIDLAKLLTDGKPYLLPSFGTGGLSKELLAKIYDIVRFKPKYNR